MAKETKDVVAPQEQTPEPAPVLVVAEQPPIPVTIVAADGVTPAPAPVAPVVAAELTAAEATVTPVAVTLTATVSPPPPATVTKGEGTTLSPTTTEAEDTTTEGQRRVNLIWEATQAGISLLITAAVVYCAIYRIPSDNLANAFFLIIGFYFSRTNHQSVGGVGPKPINQYVGRVI